MLLLGSISDLIRVTTSAATTVDVHASWVDLSGTTVTPGRTNTLISTATTTTVVASPAASTYRTVKTLTVRNRGASGNTVTILHSDGTNIPELVKVTLNADEQLIYQEDGGWWIADALFRKKIFVASDLAVQIVQLPADVATALASYQNVTGFSFPVTLNKMYWFRFDVIYACNATTTGSTWSISGPTTTYLQYQSEHSLTATTTTRNPVLTAYDLPAAANLTSAATTQNWAIVEGLIQPSASGTVILRQFSEVAVAAGITTKVGSFVRYQQITA